MKIGFFFVKATFYCHPDACQLIPSSILWMFISIFQNTSFFIYINLVLNVIANPLRLTRRNASCMVTTPLSLMAVCRMIREETSEGVCNAMLFSWSNLNTIWVFFKCVHLTMYWTFLAGCGSFTGSFVEYCTAELSKYFWLWNFTVLSDPRFNIFYNVVSWIEHHLMLIGFCFVYN